MLTNVLPLLICLFANAFSKLIQIKATLTHIGNLFVLPLERGE